MIRARSFHASSSAAYKVVVVGAAGGIGQPLSLLMKMNPLVTSLALYDVVNAKGVATDLSHINTAAPVKGYSPEHIKEALEGADLVLVPAGVPRKPGMTRDDLFNTNASIVKNIAEHSAKHCPKAAFLIISNPVNSTVPIFAEVLKKAGVLDKKKLFGVTTLDVLRASTFVAEVKKMNPKDVHVHVVGGHSGITIMPLLSQTNLKFTTEEIAALTKRIQFGGDEVVQAKGGSGSATLSMAQAGARFADSVLKAFSGQKGIVEAAYVSSPVAEDHGVEYFSTHVQLGKGGVEKILPIGPMSASESELLKAAAVELKANILKGIAFVKA